jgi:hypothetical protein
LEYYKVAKHPDSRTSWSSPKSEALVQIELEFWSTSFATPKPDNMKLDMEFVRNYPPLPSISENNNSLCSVFLPTLLHRHRPYALLPGAARMLHSPTPTGAPSPYRELPPRHRRAPPPSTAARSLPPRGIPTGPFFPRERDPCGGRPNGGAPSTPSGAPLPPAASCPDAAPTLHLLSAAARSPPVHPPPTRVAG